MPNSQPKTHPQIQRIFGLGRTVNAGKEDLEEMAGKRLSQLTFDEANALIERLGGEPLPVSAALGQRSQQIRRQKAGVKQIVTVAQLRRMNDLWFDRPGRTQGGLGQISRRVNRGNPAPRTTEECNRVIEAIKSMNSRAANTSIASGMRRSA